ncbi:hypothetical protein KOAAANKH_02546 [Brevundimonas sp. NIBR10]|uniref:hypothetical protein n=1 Tax=Brevundimonas sp. NIBR10 TaxID=3015997 RepID=UPI0022F1A0FA|nr:hypothetical protein [Brevundimonas sp. NIBR10]WGM47664.1 hypothetical protein KOAAANKH_02546 [Brevundimonas sp. NIBR10]
MKTAIAFSSFLTICLGVFAIAAGAQTANPGVSLAGIVVMVCGFVVTVIADQLED